jgi:hypothetical protein
MNRSIDRLKLIFLVIFAICCVIIWTYQALYVWPRNKCEAMGDWWDWHDRVCAVPMPIWRFTGRAPTQPTPPAAAAKPASSSNPATPVQPAKPTPAPPAPSTAAMPAPA